MTLFLILSAILVAGVLALLWRRTLSKKILIGLLVFVPSATFVLYYYIGKPQAITTTKILSTEQSDSENLAKMEQLVENLARRLEKEPENSEGWLLLARSYAALGHTAKAHAAFAKVTELERKAQSSQK